MSELHDSGFSRFPVYEGKKDNIIGTLFLKDLVNTKASAKVRDVMRRTVCYVHEDQTLQDALQAILKTHHHLLIVVNNFEDYVGILTIEDVLEQVIGKAIVDEFDQYEDIRAVAQRAALKEHKEHKEAETTSEEATEVVE
jgi:magnesium and cobalt transporter